MEQHWINKAMDAAGAIGMLRGHLLSEMLYWDDITVEQFNRSLQAFNRSYEMYGDEISEFDRGRIQTRAMEIGAQIWYLYFII